DDWRGKWLRPISFALSAGTIGALVATLARLLKLKNPALLGAVAAAGPGARAIAGFAAATMPQKADDTGFLADLKRGFVGLSDYITVAGVQDYITVQGGSGVNDYIRTLQGGRGVGALVAANRFSNSANQGVSGDSPYSMSDNGLN